MAAICPTPSQSRKRAYFDDYLSPGSCKRLNRTSADFGAGVVHRLRTLFPGMDDETLRNVLDSCAFDIDAAIEKLTSLRVSQLDDGDDRAKRLRSGDNTPHLEVTPPPPPPPPRTADDWVEAFVDEMQQSRDVADAKARAARALSAFEALVTSRTHDKVSQLDKENAVLKRAVAIQAQRLAEARDDKQRDQHVIAELRKQTHDQNEKLKQAQLSNYSLSVHLRKATDSAPFGSGAGFYPDVC
mmetsp:Transcript_9075/g.23025  ORF Transcript_9075/g.23025 Transcript_9075/m.23025 type:complete len:242 (-) Transcript_9075:633-1358(-)